MVPPRITSSRVLTALNVMLLRMLLAAIWAE
jgi:hypothetical protein